MVRGSLNRNAFVLAFAWLGAGQALAQPADLPIPAATTDILPAGVKVAHAGADQVYVDGSGHTLYGMDMRTLIARSPDPAQFCKADCMQEWDPLLAPQGTPPNIAFPPGYRGERAGAVAGTRPAFHSPQSAPDWTVIAGPQGPQWVYKGWHMVFVRRGDPPGTTMHDGADNLTWNTLKYIAPVPSVLAPAGAKVSREGRDYLLSDSAGRPLFTGTCVRDCGNWQPFAAGMASAAVGEWAVKADGDTPQWTFRGAPVFVARETEPAAIPAGGKAIRP